MTASKDDGQYSGSHKISFTEKRWYEHGWDYCTWLPQQLGTFASVAISLWAVAEVLMVASGRRVSIDELAVPILVVAIIVVLYRAYSAKHEYVPAPLHGESKAVKDIFQKQRCGWNAALAKQMLEDRLEEADGALSRIDKGAEYIPPQKLEYDEYLTWLQTRPEVVLRMVHSAALLCTQEIPVAIGSAKDEEALPELRREVEALSSLYTCAKDAEVEWHGVLPPEDFEGVHEMMYGWTQPIRKGVHQFLGVLAELESVDRKALKKGIASLPAFSIVFESPPNIEEFSRRVQAFSG
ncbi:hypothetical protein KBTX_01651 [wastewater metagenome]|uniref:Uncharacterized protein n=2 Tax=unclassified sequences TaxID=12908 RepID=A0A5B8R9R8_9ZZZZ|nr:hypothetical protein [Arhodomonas sp. KWT]QEA05331.1 hypothetical protein KBTEX_01651 [uncultured organism]